MTYIMCLVGRQTLLNQSTALLIEGVLLTLPQFFDTNETRHRASTNTHWHFTFGAMLSWQRNPCTDSKSAP